MNDDSSDDWSKMISDNHLPAANGLRCNVRITQNYFLGTWMMSCFALPPNSFGAAAGSRSKSLTFVQKRQREQIGFYS